MSRGRGRYNASAATAPSAAGGRGDATGVARRSAWRATGAASAWAVAGLARVDHHPGPGRSLAGLRQRRRLAGDAPRGGDLVERELYSPGDAGRHARLGSSGAPPADRPRPGPTAARAGASLGGAGRPARLAADSPL